MTTHTPLRTSEHKQTQKSPRVQKLLVVLLAAVALGGLASCSSDNETATTPETTVETTVARESVTHEFVVPAGTAVRISAKEQLDIIPSEILVHVGDRIRVTNEDIEVAQLGIFDVQPGETVTMNFTRAGRMQGVVFSDEGGGCGAPPPDVETFIIDILP